MYFTLCQLLLILGEQDWDRASFQIEVSDLIQLIAEDSASGPTHSTEYVTFIVETYKSCYSIAISQLEGDTGFSLFDGVYKL